MPPKIPLIITSKHTSKILKKATSSNTNNSSRVYLKTPINYVFSGDVKTAVFQHSFERVRHFITFTSYMNLLVEHFKKNGHNQLTLSNAITPSALFQVEKGYYVGKSHSSQSLSRFDPRASDLLDRSVTGEIDVVAAHYNNMAPSRYFLKIAESELEKNPDSLLLNKGMEVIIAMCADTNIIPREINSGPDKVIDTVNTNQIRKITTFPNGAPLPSSKTVSEYIDHGKSRILSWEASEIGKKNISNLYKIAGPYNDGLESARTKVRSNVSLDLECLLQDVIESGDKTLLDISQILRNL